MTDNKEILREVGEPQDTPTSNIAEKKKREPLFHISKRASLSMRSAVTIRTVAILLAFILAGLVTLILLKQNPFITYKTMFEGVFGANTWVSLRSTAVLLCIALALTPAFKMRFWNTGAEGQVLVGALAGAFCMYYFYSLPTPLLITVMVIFSAVAGAIWGVIPAIFKAFFGTNETLFTLMMNSVAACLTLFMMKFWSQNTSAVGKEILDPEGKVNDAIGTNYFAVIAVVLIITLLLYIYLKYSKHGYEISVVGESENTAKYIGINVKHVIIRTMIISGAIAGIAGFLIVAPAQNISNNIVSGRGFTAIMVAWLAKFNPIMMIFSAFLFIFVSNGGQEISTILGFESAYSDILTGLLLFFIIGCEFFISYKLTPTARFRAITARVREWFSWVWNKIRRVFKKENGEGDK